MYEILCNQAKTIKKQLLCSSNVPLNFLILHCSCGVFVFFYIQLQPLKKSTSKCRWLYKTLYMLQSEAWAMIILEEPVRENVDQQLTHISHELLKPQPCGCGKYSRKSPKLRSYSGRQISCGVKSITFPTDSSATASIISRCSTPRVAYPQLWGRAISQLMTACPKRCVQNQCVYTFQVTGTLLCK